jgi:hypothetical protein
VSGAASLYDEVSGYGGVACHGSANITMNAKYTACPNSAQETIMNKSVWHHITFVDYGTDCGSSVIIPDSGGGTYTGPGLWQYQSGGGLEGGNYISELLGLGNPCCGKNACAPCDSDGDGTDDGVCVGNMCTALEAFQECRDGAIVDKTDDPASMDVELVGEPEKDPNFVSWGTMEVKYKVTPESVKATDYKVEVATGTPTRDGHNGLGKSAPKIVSHDATNKSVKFSVGVTPGNTNGSTAKAKPLAVELKFLTTGGALIKKFLLQQDDRNVIREEYRAFEYGTKPVRDDFDGKLKDEYYAGTRVYTAEDVPHGDHLNTMIGKLPSGKFQLTSTYRNPFYQGTFRAKTTSRHPWSGAMDVDGVSPDYQGTLLDTWEVINNEGMFPQALVESNDNLLINRLYEILLEAISPDIIKNSIMINKVTINGNERGHGNDYTVVWSKRDSSSSNKGWALLEFSYATDCTTSCNIYIETYVLSLDDWNGIAGNLHIQDTKYYEEGFKQ